MSNTKTLWWVLLLAWMGGSTYWHVCKIKQLCDAPMLAEAPSVSDEVIPTLTPLSIRDENALILNAPGNFGFARSGFEPNLNAVQIELDSMAKYLLANPTKRLTLTGAYHGSETNGSTFTDLGLARASAIRAYLVGKGVPDSIFVVKSSLSDSLQFVADSLRGGIGFAFATWHAPANETELAEAQKYESIFKPLDLYFPTAGTAYIKTGANAAFLVEAKKYLEAHPDKKLLLTGHTDNVDSAEWNLKLSRKRAESVKKEFVAAGISSARINTDGKGMTVPKADNKTEEGRRANRRVTIVVQ